MSDSSTHLAVTPLLTVELRHCCSDKRQVVPWDDYLSGAKNRYAYWRIVASPPPLRPPPTRIESAVCLALDQRA
jgi:hypothetical protein